MRTLDRRRVYGQVIGMSGVAYSQDHAYFDDAGNEVQLAQREVIRADDQGRPVAGTEQYGSPIVERPPNEDYLNEVVRKVEAPEPDQPVKGSELSDARLREMLAMYDEPFSGRQKAMTFLRSKGAIA